MRKFRMGILSLAALAAWGTPAMPAETKSVPEEGAVQVMLLRQRSVREALKLTPEEAKKIHDFTLEQWRKAGEAEKMAPAERDRTFAQLSQENERFLGATLEPAQKKRLDEITLQIAGLLWVTRPAIAAALNLSPAQKTKAREYQEEARKEMEELLHATKREERHEKRKELHETSRKRLLELLTDEQEVKWKEMIGAPFHGELHYEHPEAR